jgi:hypothetical protein
MSPVAPIAEDAQSCAVALQDTMTELKALIEQETSLVRVGDLTATVQLEPKKSEAARRYVAAVLKARLVQPLMARLMPDVLQSLQTQHDFLRAALKVNTTVLATAHAVSESVVRGVNAEVQRRSGPQTYTNQGQHSASAPRQAMPIAFSRVL